MKLFAFYCRDGELAPQIRPKVRADHFAYLAEHADDYALGGPLLREEEPLGSLIIVKAADEAAARARFEGDPYYVSGVWQSINMTEFKALTGEWVRALGLAE